MLGRPREARDTPDERVVAAVRAVVVARDDLVKAVRGHVATAGRHVDPDAAQARCGHGDQQSVLGLATGRQIGQA